MNANQHVKPPIHGSHQVICALGAVVASGWGCVCPSYEFVPKCPGQKVHPVGYASGTYCERALKVFVEVPGYGTDETGGT